MAGTLIGNFKFQFVFVFKAELLQLNETQFICLRKLIDKKLEIKKTKSTLNVDRA
jgi:hypothetical protein